MITTLSVPNVPLVVCVFCSVDISSLGPLLSEIIVTLTPFMDKFPSIVSDVFHYLIVENESVTG